MAILIDGKETAKTIREEIKLKIEYQKTESFSSEELHLPGLGIILVGDRVDSHTYVRMKKNACKEVGIESYVTELPGDASEEEIVKKVVEFNSNPNIHGILIQLPLPPHVHEANVLASVKVEKDVDGLHPLNIAALATFRPPRNITWREASSLFPLPCTPNGCIELLDRYHLEIEGKHAVVVGRSDIVGLPMALLLMKRNATITVCHSQTINLKEKVASADILVVAIGKAEFINGNWIKEGAVVIDVGINSVDDIQAKKGYRLVGDVEYKTAQLKAHAITPVPGGVGPMTIAMLMQNTFDSYLRSKKNQKLEVKTNL